MRLDQLKRAAAKLGLEVEDDKEACIIYVQTAPGMRLEEDLHYYSEDYVEQDAKWRAEAIQDAFDRLDEYTPEPCDVRGCDWCDPADYNDDDELEPNPGAEQEAVTHKTYYGTMALFDNIEDDEIYANFGASIDNFEDPLFAESLAPNESTLHHTPTGRLKKSSKQAIARTQAQYAEMVSMLASIGVNVVDGVVEDDEYRIRAAGSR
jgi:hypothetical protein